MIFKFPISELVLPLRLIKSIEGWASKESRKRARTDCIWSSFGFWNYRIPSIYIQGPRNSQNLIGAISRAKQHLEKEYKFDSEIDKMHIKFAQEMEELDLRLSVIKNSNTTSYP